MTINIRQLKEIIDSALEKEGGDLEVVTTGYYGEPHEYDKSDFDIRTVELDETLHRIEPRKVFAIECKDIGPEPD